jgi:diguanylate cyclase (GGDEF)-like protein
MPSRPTAHPARGALVAAGLLAFAAFAASTLLRPEPGYVAALDAGLYNVPFVVAIALLADRARRRPDRLAWALLAAGLAAFTVANLYGSLVLGHLAEPPYPSFADGLWIAFYPLAGAGILLLVRSARSGTRTATLLDGMVAALGVSALCVTATVAWSGADTSGDLAEVVTNIAYPAGDMILVAVVAGVLGMLGWRLSPALILIALGLVAFFVADLLFLIAEAGPGYTEGGPLDIGWPLGATLLGLAALTAPARPDPGERLSPWVLAVPGAAAVGALALLVAGQGGTVPGVAVVLAVGALLAALLRVALSFREVQALADSRRQARTDDLTGLPNRRAFSERLSGACRDDCRGAVLLVDLDRFKEINDSLGHGVGDRLLVEVGRRLQHAVRGDDLLARLGGDEFALVLRGAEEVRALEVADRLRALVARPMVVAGLTLHLDASVGIAVAPDHGRTGDALLQHADVALYAAKARRTGAEVYDAERDRPAIERLETIEALRTAIADGEIEVHYQPKQSLATGAATGLEALVRWRRPGRGLVSPGAFVPLADQAGLMGPLTTVVLEDAARRCRRWRDAGHQVSVAVNVSASRLVDASLPGEVERVLAAAGLPGDALVIEVTEDSAMTAPERSGAALRRLRDLGVGIAIDDYGTGHSSLSYLRELPVTELKLDRAFITGLGVDPHLAPIVRSTVDLAHALGLRVVGEGVEDQVALDLLARLGGDEAQGYLIARPMPAGDVEGWLAARQLTDVRALAESAATTA